MDGGIECTLSLQVCWSHQAVDILWSREAIQRDLGRLLRGGSLQTSLSSTRPRNSSQSVRKVLGLRQSQTHMQVLVGEWIKSIPEEKDLGVLVGEKIKMTWASSSESKDCPALHQKQHGQQIKGCGPPTILSSCGPYPESCVHLTDLQRTSWNEFRGESQG